MSKNNDTPRIPDVRDTVRPAAGRYASMIQRFETPGVCYWTEVTVDGFQRVFTAIASVLANTLAVSPRVQKSSIAKALPVSYAVRRRAA